MSKSRGRVGAVRKKRRRVRRPPPGAPPGEVAVQPTAEVGHPTAIIFNPAEISERSIKSPGEIEPARDAIASPNVLWLNVDGVGDAKLVQHYGDRFNLHKLTQADIVNVYQRAKVEDYQEYLYIVLRMPSRNGGGVETEQISVCLGRDFVLTFQEREGDCFDPVRRRIQDPTRAIRQNGADYLAYALLDAVVDSYFPILEQIADQLERLEDISLTETNDATPREIHRIKRDLWTIRRAVWPLREALSSLTRDTFDLFTDKTKLYLRDCYDHTVQILDLVESQRELCSSLLDLYLSNVSHRSNEVMKVLTIIATIFIPLTFIAGIYGMNFDSSESRWNMPELQWDYGYPLALLVMALVGVGTFYYFHRKGWIGASDAHDRNGSGAESLTQDGSSQHP